MGTSSITSFGENATSADREVDLLGGSHGPEARRDVPASTLPWLRVVGDVLHDPLHGPRRLERVRDLTEDDVDGEALPCCRGHLAAMGLSALERDALVDFDTPRCLYEFLGDLDRWLPGLFGREPRRVRARLRGAGYRPLQDGPVQAGRLVVLYGTGTVEVVGLNWVANGALPGYLYTWREDEEYSLDYMMVVPRVALDGSEGSVLEQWILPFEMP